MDEVGKSQGQEGYLAPALVEWHTQLRVSKLRFLTPEILKFLQPCCLLNHLAMS